VASLAVVGDAKTLLLCVCNVTAKHGEVALHTYDQPHHVPVGHRDFDMIKIAVNNVR
jgi:hypothetical protein